MKRILIFTLFLSFCASNMLAQKDSIESRYQKRWNLEERTKEFLCDINSYLIEIAGAAYRTTNERILAMKYQREVLNLFAGKGNSFKIQGTEYKPMITLIDKTGKIVKRLSPKTFCTLIMHRPRTASKFTWCKIRIPTLTKEHCKQISSNEYIIDAWVDTNFDNYPNRLKDEKIEKIKIIVQHALIETPEGTKDYYYPLFVDIYAFIQ